jgi:hypothetical protein
MIQQNLGTFDRTNPPGWTFAADSLVEREFSGVFFKPSPSFDSKGNAGCPGEASPASLAGGFVKGAFHDAYDYFNTIHAGNKSTVLSLDEMDPNGHGKIPRGGTDAYEILVKLLWIGDG